MTTATKPLLPPIQARGIYEEKFVDRTPDIIPAGKWTYLPGYGTAVCMKTPKRPPSPDIVKRFRGYFRSDPGDERVFYGTARDIHRAWATDMRHGIIPPLSGSLKKTVNPDPLTLFQQKTFDKHEMMYYNTKVAPLGTTHEQDIPKGIDKEKFVFGMRSKLDCGAGKLMNPNKSYEQVYAEGRVGAEMYKRTHCSYDSGEQVTRSYTEPFLKTAAFGLGTPHYEDGRHVKKTLHWLFERDAEKETPVMIERVDHFLEKTQPQIGKVLDPNLETRGHLSPDHTFGILLKSDGYGAGDLVHNRIPRDFLRGRERQRGLVSAIRQNLKKANYQNFHDLLSAFCAYDKDNKGHIDINDLREACMHYDLPVEPELLEQLLDYCDVSKTGAINYVEFANFLNWRDKLPATTPSTNCDITGVVDTGAALSQESTPRRLQKQIDRAIGSQKTSADMINAVVGGLSTKDYRTYGLPSVRTDIAAPYVRRVDDKTNYGDESDANGLLNPSLFSNLGVHEIDLLSPRSKDEILKIFTNIGVEMSPHNLSGLYDKIAAAHPNGQVSVESFRSNLDILALHQIAQHEDQMAKL